MGQQNKNNNNNNNDDDDDDDDDDGSNVLRIILGMLPLSLGRDYWEEHQISLIQSVELL